MELHAAWLELRANNPGILEHYLMVIAAEVRRVLSSKPQDISLKDFKLKFEEEVKLPPTKRQEQKFKEQLSQVMRASLQAMSAPPNKRRRQKRPQSRK